MKKYSALFKTIFSYGGVFLFFLPAFAAGSYTPVRFSPVVEEPIFICSVILGWINIFFIVLTGIFILFAVYKYFTAENNEKFPKSARNMLICAAIAFAIALLARGTPFIVGALFSNAILGC